MLIIQINDFIAYYIFYLKKFYLYISLNNILCLSFSYSIFIIRQNNEKYTNNNFSKLTHLQYKYIYKCFIVKKIFSRIRLRNYILILNSLTLETHIFFKYDLYL